MNERYFFISYSVKNDRYSGFGNWGYITKDGSFFDKKIVGKSIADKIGFNQEDIVIINFVEFERKSDLNDFFDLEKS